MITCNGHLVITLELELAQDGIDVFINKLYRQPEYCHYGTLREELIRDRLVVGVTDDMLRNKLQSELNLTLEAEVNMCRLHRSAKQAQTAVTP